MPDPAPETPVEPPSRCKLEVPPARPVPPAPVTCRKVAAPLALEVEHAVAPRFVPTITGATLGVKVACDPLSDRAAELVFEQGSGHGFSLVLWRLTRLQDGARYALRAIAFADDPRFKRPTPNPHFLLGEDTLDASAVDALLPFVRAALLAELRQIDPPPSGGLGLSGTSSSSDFHLAFRVRDAAGRELARHYTGYAGSQGQLTYLPLQAAAERLEPLLARVSLVARPATSEDHAHFDERFTDSVPRFDDDFAWWLMERYVALARDLGTAAIAPGLLTRLRPEATDRSPVDAQHDALEGLARVVGWDARRGAHGEPLSDADAARAYLAECKPRRAGPSARE